MSANDTIQLIESRVGIENIEIQLYINRHTSWIKTGEIFQVRQRDLDAGQNIEIVAFKTRESAKAYYDKLIRLNADE